MVSWRDKTVFCSKPPTAQKAEILAVGGFEQKTFYRIRCNTEIVRISLKYLLFQRYEAKGAT
jgi:hypothetical protein